ncbi:MAG TPA: DUF5818 domain-containing protein [Candidatus Acidoferrum sp.]|jgi:hypothetical protein|nr:DUF5818 domain-containing protein [Candidatus Acidoferrum sp.]
MTKTTWRFFLVIWMLAGTIAISQRPIAADEKTFRGEIADTQCALNVHSLSKSHKEMLGMKPDLKTDADCARFCVKERGGKFVLQSKEKVYRLDKPDEAESFAGQQVKIVGTLDPKTNTITVLSVTQIAPIPPGSAHPQ